MTAIQQLFHLSSIAGAGDPVTMLFQEPFEQIADIGGVQSVSFDDTRDHYTNASALYDITFDYSEDDDRCETVMNDIESALDGYDMYVSATFGDTASKTLAQEIGVIVIIVAIVAVILSPRSKSVDVIKTFGETLSSLLKTVVSPVAE